MYQQNIKFNKTSSTLNANYYYFQKLKHLQKIFLTS